MATTLQNTYTVVITAPPKYTPQYTWISPRHSPKEVLAKDFQPQQSRRFAI